MSTKEEEKKKNSGTRILIEKIKHRFKIDLLSHLSDELTKTKFHLKLYYLFSFQSNCASDSMHLILAAIFDARNAT